MKQKPTKINEGVCGSDQVRAVKGSGAKDPAKNTLNSAVTGTKQVRK
jgi:hypothetical protein